MDQAFRRMKILCVAIPGVFMAAVLLLPALEGVVLSFDACGPSLRNYELIAHDPMFWRALGNNLVIPFASLIVELVLGLLLALYLTSRQRPAAVVEIAAILPFAIPEIVLLAIARYLLMPRGYVNAALGATGLGPAGWLVPGHALAAFTVIVVDAWHVTPVVMLILMAGLQTIRPEIYEAARLDGAGPLATFRYITLPLLAPAIIAAAVLRGVDALRIFSTALVLTGAEGVPVLSTYAYQLWSDAGQPHAAMAASVVLAVLITFVGIAGVALVRRLGVAGEVT
jgi:trehalose transport system permease protein